MAAASPLPRTRCPATDTDGRLELADPLLDRLAPVAPVAPQTHRRDTACARLLVDPGLGYAEQLAYLICCEQAAVGAAGSRPGRWVQAVHDLIVQQQGDRSGRFCPAGQSPTPSVW